jgi:hypothetical protein
MKRMQLLTAAFLFVFAASLTSCKPSRVWATKDKEKKEKKSDRYEKDDDDRYDRDYSYDRRETVPPPPPAPRKTYNYNYVRLVITPSAGFVMNRYPDGRFYHRDANGLLYWKGHDNRFFLDRSYLSRIKYDSWEYEQWKKLYYFSNERGGYGSR